MTHPTCETCLYWRPMKGTTDGRKTGQCQRHSPQLEGGRDHPTYNNYWCGDWVSKDGLEDMRQSLVHRADNIEAQNLATVAIYAVLNRIRRESNLQLEIGRDSLTFATLTKALAKLTGRNVDEVREAIIPGSAALHAEPDPTVTAPPDQKSTEGTDPKACE